MSKFKAEKTFDLKYIYLPLKALAELEFETSQIQDMSFYHQTKFLKFYRS